MKAREIKKARRLLSSLLAMTVLLAGVSVFAEAYNPDKVTVTSDNFESYSTISRAGGGDFPTPYQSTEQFTLYKSSYVTDIDSTEYPKLKSLFTEFMESDSYNNLTEDQKNNLQNWMIVDGNSDSNGNFSGWGRPTVFNIVKTDDKNNNATLNNVENNSFLRIKAIAGMSNFVLYKKLNADPDIQKKELTFKVSFKIPADGMKYAGDGFGIWLNNKDMSRISTWANFDYNLDKDTPDNLANPACSYNKRELMAIKSVRETDGVKIKLYAFGNNVTTETPVVLEKNTEYTYTLTMTPDSSDGYNLSGKLSKVVDNTVEDTTIWFSPANWQDYASGIPKRADIASMTHMTVMAAHNDGIINGDIAANASDQKYINGHSMIYVDDISLTADYTYPTSEMEGTGLSATARKNGNNVYVNVKNTAADEKNIKLIAAVYDGDQLKGVKIDNTVSVIESNGTQKVEFNFGEGEIADGNKVKVFIWDSLSNVTPLTTAAEF